MQRFLNQLVPFLLFGIAIVAFALGVMLLAYLFLFGAIVGLILFIISWVKLKFFSPKMPTAKPKTRPGRIIDSDDWRKL